MTIAKASIGRGTTIKRQWALLKILKAEGGTIAELAKTLNCDDKTIRRDLNILQDVGFAVYNEDEGDVDAGVGKKAWLGTWRLVDRRII